MAERTKITDTRGPQGTLQPRVEPLARLSRTRTGRILQLQRTIGNQAVQRLIQAGVLHRGRLPRRGGPNLWRSRPGAVQRGDEDKKEGQEKEDFDYYRDVASQIIRIAQERGITFEQAAHVVAQAIAEQGVRDPSKFRFRMFNMMPTWNEMQKLKKGEKGVLQAGVRLVWLTSPEFIGGKYVDRKSPFFVYDDLETAINHYFDRMDTMYKRASEALKQPDTPIHEFGRRLKAGGYATEKDYAKKVVKAYKVAARGIDGWLAGRIQEDEAAIAKGWPALSRAWGELNHWKDRVKSEQEPVAKATAQEMVSFLEDAISRMEAAMKKREEQVKKLRATRKRFAKRASR